MADGNEQEVANEHDIADESGPFGIDLFAFRGSESHLLELLKELGQRPDCEISSFEKSDDGYDRAIRLNLTKDLETAEVEIEWSAMDNGFWLCSIETDDVFPKENHAGHQRLRDQLLSGAADLEGFVLYETRSNSLLTPNEPPSGTPTKEQIIEWVHEMEQAEARSHRRASAGSLFDMVFGAFETVGELFVLLLRVVVGGALLFVGFQIFQSDGPTVAALGSAAFGVIILVSGFW